MTPHLRTLHRLRRQIPAFACIPGCHDCCGPVTAASEEVAQLPPKSITEHEQAWAELDCPYLGKNGCEVYADRPLICRLFGTTPKLPCPHGRSPKDRVPAVVEQQVWRFLQETRQVLL